MTIGRIDINEKDLPKICGAIIQLEERVDSSIVTDAITAAVAANAGVLSCGRLAYVSATALKFAPYNGNKIKISGSLYTIPSAGIAGVANTSVFVNGTGSSNLAASTTYWVFAFVNSGTVTVDFRTAATHTQSTTALNEGVEILTGDDSRSLIGMCRTNASSQFADAASNRAVISWFNRHTIQGSSTFTVDRTTTSASFVELNSEIRTQFLTWGEEDVIAAIGGSAFGSGISTLMVGVAFDGTTPAQLTGNVIAAAGYSMNCACTAVSRLSEEYHYATLVGNINGGTATFYSADSLTSAKCRTWVAVRG